MAKSKWESVQAKLHLIEKWARDGLREDTITQNLEFQSTISNTKPFPKFIMWLIYKADICE